MAVSLKRSVSTKVFTSWCTCCGPLVQQSSRREVVKLRRSVRHYEKAALLRAGYEDEGGEYDD